MNGTQQPQAASATLLMTSAREPPLPLKTRSPPCPTTALLISQTLPTTFNFTSGSDTAFEQMLINIKVSHSYPTSGIHFLGLILGQSQNEVWSQVVLKELHIHIGNQVVVEQLPFDGIAYPSFKPTG